MNAKIRKISTLLLIGAFAFGVGACNTMKGVGKDTEQAGKKIQQEADEHKRDDNRKDDDRPDAPAASEASR
jgi:predicted small secreted protein